MIIRVRKSIMRARFFSWLPTSLGCLIVAFSQGFLAILPLSADAASLPATTRKVVLEKIENGYRWKLTEVSVPTPGDRQVLIHVRAVALNRGDLEVLEPDARRDYSGRVPGSDAAGDVVDVGKEVRSVRRGQRVTSLYFKNWVDGPPNDDKLSAAHGVSADGVLGDYIVLEETAVTPMPEGLTYEEAATLPTAGVTAWMATAGQRDIHADDVVLVQGTGGVSIFALQFAAAAGARVIVTSSADEKLRRVQALGAKDGINYRTTPQWSERIRKLTNGHGADLIVDVGGKSTLEQSVQSLAYLGTVSLVGGLTGYGGSVPSLGLLLKSARAQGVYVGSRADYQRMSAYIVKHQIHPVIDRVFPLDQYQAALQHMAAGDFVGKIVLRL
jgi:NADPH:quinone reductase-like Zn-dependent oxidoreductase